MYYRYKTLIFSIIALFVLRDCLCNNRKNEEDVIDTAPISIPVSIALKDTFSSSVNRNIFGINIGFALKRELDKDSGFVQLLRELHPASLRFPGGTVANYYHPELPVYGYRVSEIPAGLGTLYMEQNKRQENILYNYMRLCKLVGAKAVYCANLLTGTTSEVLFVIETLQKNNIPVLGIELGNEFSLMEYRSKFPDAKTYIDKVRSTAHAIHKRFPELRVAVVAGDGVATEEKSTRSRFMYSWNQTLAKENFYQAYTWHPYQDCAACDKDTYFDKVYLRNLLSLAPFQTNNLSRLSDNFTSVYGKDRKIWLTEWNIGNLNYLDNTFMQGAYVAENFLSLLDLNSQSKDIFELTCLHSMEGLISRQQGKLAPVYSKGGNHASVQYFAFKFLSSTLDSGMYKTQEVVYCEDASVKANFICKAYHNKKLHKTYLYFINRSGKEIQFKVDVVRKSPIHIYAVDAKYPYATAGKTNYEKDYPDKLKAVVLREEFLEDAVVRLAPYSFGYVDYNN